jgi:hypothetical protein
MDEWLIFLIFAVPVLGLVFGMLSGLRAGRYR